MAITISENRGARTASIDPTYISKYKRTFTCITDDGAYGPKYVLDQMGLLGFIPSILSTYNTGGTHPESDFGAQVLDVDVAELGGENTDGRQWIASVTYGPWNPDVYAPSPVMLPAVLSVEGQNFQKIIDVDINGNPLANAAGDPYDPGVAVDKQRLVIRITQNLQTWPSFAFSYTDFLNANPVWGFDAKVLKQAPPQIEREYHPNCGRYYKCHFLFDHSPEGWQAKQANVGFRQLVSGVQTQILDAHGVEVTSPQWLDSSGASLTPPVNASDIITNKYDVYQTVDYASVYASFGPLP